MSFTKPTSPTYLGQQLDITVEFQDSTGVDADPDTVRFFLREEVDGTELSWLYSGSPVQGTNYPAGMFPISKDSTGNYRLPYIARKRGLLSVVMNGSGTLFQTAAGSFTVTALPVQAFNALFE